MKRMRKCKSCGAYTLHEEHCGKPTASPHPPRYSPGDRYARYRREALKSD
ncbi:TPA: ribosome biogenesis protein [Candidatus Micrarchaeota archaeon]|nr:ribosome biogenesis protein [Candidatus Micrarchaeota archaeon]HIH30061.1 ribosome biogenesis protein [Candidatus Micrarchaeota archaeon]